jgi:HSP20 family protein
MNRSTINPMEALYNVVPAELRDSIFNVLLNPDSSSATSTIPTTVVKNDESILIYAEMPGFEKDSIEVDFFNNKVNIAGTKNGPSEDQGRVLSAHIKYGRFTKGLGLPVSVTDRKNVTVSYKEGVLTITINLQAEEENKFSLNLSEEKEVENLANID